MLHFNFASVSVKIVQGSHTFNLSVQKVEGHKGIYVMEIVIFDLNTFFSIKTLRYKFCSFSEFQHISSYAGSNAGQAEFYHANNRTKSSG
jgi:hypothetical protein